MPKVKLMSQQALIIGAAVVQGAVVGMWQWMKGRNQKVIKKAIA